MFCHLSFKFESFWILSFEFSVNVLLKLFHVKQFEWLLKFQHSIGQLQNIIADLNVKQDLNNDAQCTFLQCYAKLCFGNNNFVVLGHFIVEWVKNIDINICNFKCGWTWSIHPVGERLQSFKSEWLLMLEVCLTSSLVIFPQLGVSQPK